MKKMSAAFPEKSKTPQQSCDFARLVDVQMIPSETGEIGVVEASRQIGFTVRRIYFLTNLVEGAPRGAHAHKALRQCFICLRGAVDIRLKRMDETVTFRLDRPSQALQLDAGCWRDILNPTADALLLVLASEEFDEADYIRDYEKFRHWEASLREVPYVDLKRYTQLMHGRFEGAVHESISSGIFIGGPAVAKFEVSFAKMCHADNAVGLGNGLEALSVALKMWGVGPGDEVIIPAHTFVATALAVDEVGATAVLVDVERDTGLIDPAQIEAAITPRTKAIVPVHLYGHPADMDGIRRAIGGRDIRILEDAAQAHGALYKGAPCGSLGDAAAFSFYPTKNLGALGDGGAIVTSDGELARLVRRYANYGSAEKYHHEVTGINSRLDPLHASVLSAKLPFLAEWNARRRLLAAKYIDALNPLEGLTMPAVRNWAEPVWHVFPVQVHEGRRNALLHHLKEHRIGTNVHYPVPIHRQACYAGRWPGTYPVAEQLAQNLLSLPLDPTHTDEELDRVIDVIREFFGAGV